MTMQTDGPIERTNLSNSNRPITTLAYWAGDHGQDRALIMDQPYQRGDVWGLKRRRNLIRSLLMGVPIPSIVVNDRFSAGWREPGATQEEAWGYAIVDGKQRVTTILMFLRGEFSVPRTWFEDRMVGDDWDDTDDGPYIRFPHLTDVGRRVFENTLTISVSEGKVRTLAEERELFDLVNFGGLAQGEQDTDAVAVEA